MLDSTVTLLTLVIPKAVLADQPAITEPKQHMKARRTVSFLVRGSVREPEDAGMSVNAYTEYVRGVFAGRLRTMSPGMRDSSHWMILVLSCFHLRPMAGIRVDALRGVSAIGVIT